MLSSQIYKSWAWQSQLLLVDKSAAARILVCITLKFKVRMHAEWSICRLFCSWTWSNLSVMLGFYGLTPHPQIKDGLKCEVCYSLTVLVACLLIESCTWGLLLLNCDSEDHSIHFKELQLHLQYCIWDHQRHDGVKDWENEQPKTQRNTLAHLKALLSRKNKYEICLPILYDLPSPTHYCHNSHIAEASTSFAQQCKVEN